MQHSDEEAKSAGTSLCRSVPTLELEHLNLPGPGSDGLRGLLMTKESPDDVLLPLRCIPSLSNF